MICLDTNILISLFVSSDERHAIAMNWLRGVNDRLCFTPVNAGEILRLLTHPRVFKNPMKLKDAISAVTDFQESFSVEILDESRDWLADLADLSSGVASLRGNDIFDARIALCLKFNGVREIATWDLNFRRFSFLKCIQPGSESI